ncbi:pentapeptide repeat-containing protein [Nocardia mexicana]|uniref:pentapeptide repeat-containing protein n=1 Tax=Nocardia mexicana TaxID=279262 RepID=UPI001471CBDE
MFQRTRFQRTVFQRSRFQRTVFQRSRFQRTVFQRSRFQRSRFRRSRFRRTVFQHHRVPAHRWTYGCRFESLGIAGLGSISGRIAHGAISRHRRTSRGLCAP